METKFTPGPWKVCYDGQIFSEHGKYVCSFRWSSFNEFNKDPEAAATARLIAAAPELYAEMERYLPILEALETMSPLWANLTQGTGIATLNGYRAALALATRT